VAEIASSNRGRREEVAKELLDTDGVDGDGDGIVGARGALLSTFMTPESSVWLAGIAVDGFV
jgi:hypothetical protein